MTRKSTDFDRLPLLVLSKHSEEQFVFGLRSKRKAILLDVPVDWLALLFCILGVLGSNVGPETRSVDAFRGFAQFLYANGGIVSAS